jgi:DEAD/DEAH box helicase domain-containing protein
MIDNQIKQVLSRWQGGAVARQLCCHEVLPAQEARTDPFPERLSGPLVEGLQARGIQRLFRHQSQSVAASLAGRDVVVATPTASGKTLCYNLPVFDALISSNEARALYLFPTKALARDQIEEARALARAVEQAGAAPVGVAVYDGDTPPDRRRAARRSARIIATNPDMLHSGILPHHPSWAEFLSGLRYVVVDELHTYRGVFGSHVANVLRRLSRIAELHGARPQFIATSATIANPGELAAVLFGREVELVEESGAPTGERHYLIYNPPVVDAALGLREGAMRSACRLVCDLVQADIGTLVFCRSRLAVEVMVRELRDHLARLDKPEVSSGSVRGYRGGYLPDRRREVEHALRRGDTDVVVATSALELGIDIGSLDAVVLVGWPGSRAAAWQRAGRAGRRLEPSLAVLVASSEPVDQFVAADPGYLFGQAPEHARANPDNPSVLVPHLKCAAAELPFAAGEAYGSCDARATAEVLDCLSEAGLLHRGASGGHHYTGHPHPSSEVHLRGHLDENFLVVRQPDGRVVAEVDYQDAPQVLHDKAIYQLEGGQYEVLHLDHERRKAFVAPVNVGYYTDAMTHTRVRVLEPLSQQAQVAFYGEVHVVNRVVGFKKIKLHTGENVGYGDVTHPEREMHTTAFWLALAPEWVRRLERSPGEIAAATLGVAHALRSVAALLLMSDARDLGRAVGDARSGWFAVTTSRGRFALAPDGADLCGPTAPVIFLFDRYAGGTGLSDRLFEERLELMTRARRTVERCGCRAGCPACIGPGGRDPRVRELAAGLLGLAEEALRAAPAPLASEPLASGVAP